MSTTAPELVTVVIPAWNEAADIAGCLEQVATQSYRRIEVVIADGCSTDDTPTIVVDAAARLGLDLCVVPNPARRTANGLNAALAAARGRYVVRVDARSRIGEQHVARAVAVLRERPEVGVVGGGQRAVCRSASLLDRGIARGLRNRYSTGLSRYRRARAAGCADTVWMGAFRTDDLRGLGGWNPDVALNEDYELNARYRAEGSVVWFDPALDAGYLPRPDFWCLARQYFRFGRVKGTWWARGSRPAARQVLLIAVPAVAGAALAGAVSAFGAPAAGALVLGSLIAVEVIGGDGPATPAERVVATGASVVSCGSWWCGVVIGLVGERVGVRHAHS